jgi:uncharacterized membrane protein
MQIRVSTGAHSRALGRWVAALTGLIIGTYLALTPGNLLSLAKADMVAYAVCHRVGDHSFFICGQQLPLCVRCSGTFLGALTGLLGQAVVLRRKRASDFPRVGILLLMGGFFLAMAVDGVNSYASDWVIHAPLLYPPHDLLRLVTGALTGLSISVLLYPVFNLSVWKAVLPERAVRGFRDLGVLLLLEGGLVISVWALAEKHWPPLLSGWSLVPLAVLSAAGVLTMLTLVNSVLVMMVAGWENRYGQLHEAIVPLMLGFDLALIQIGAIDALRYAFTGVLEGMPGL